MMAGKRSAGQAQTAAWATVVLGVWLSASAWTLGFASNATALWTGLLAGAAVVALSLAAARARELSWAAAALGGWVVLAPFVLGFASSGAAVANDVLIGVAIVVVAATHARRP